MVDIDEADLGAEDRVTREGELTVEVGDTLPGVTLASTAGGDVSLTETAATRHVVLVFYPGDLEGIEYPELMGCTPQGCSVRDNLQTIADLGAAVYGVNFHSTDRQREFVEREQLTYELLSDQNETLTEALGIPRWMSEDGERFVARTTVIAEQGGAITHVIEEPTVEGHAEEIIARLRELSTDSVN
jgi:peroxiredoxin Q/BCP